MKLDTPEKIKDFLTDKTKNDEQGKSDNFVITPNGTHYSLENGELKVIKPSHFHSWEYVTEKRKILDSGFK